MMRRLFSLLMLAVCLGSLYGCFAGLQEDAPVAPQALPMRPSRRQQIRSPLPSR